MRKPRTLVWAMLTTLVVLTLLYDSNFYTPSPILTLYLRNQHGRPPISTHSVSTQGQQFLHSLNVLNTSIRPRNLTVPILKIEDFWTHTNTSNNLTPSLSPLKSLRIRTTDHRFTAYKDVQKRLLCSARCVFVQVYATRVRKSDMSGCKSVHAGPSRLCTKCEGARERNSRVRGERRRSVRDTASPRYCYRSSTLLSCEVGRRGSTE